MEQQLQLDLFKKKILTVMVVALGIYLIYLSKDILSKLGIAILFMVILDPLVKYFMKFMPRKNRLIAILVTFLVIGAIAFLVLARLVPIVSDQFGQAVSALNSAAAEAQSTGKTLSQTLAENNPTSSVDALMPYIAKTIPAILSFITSSISSLLSGLFAQLMVFGFVFFGLIEGPRMVDAIKKALPKERVKEAVWTSRTLYESVTSYITGNLFISAVAGGVTAIFSFIIGLPYIGLIAVAVAICDLIPMFGAYLFGIFLGLFSFLFLGWDAAVISVIYVIIYQQFENQILSPIVYNKANKLSPLTVLVVVSIGGAVAGLLGALIAIPVGSTVQALIQKHLSKREGATK